MKSTAKYSRLIRLIPLMRSQWLRGAAPAFALALAFALSALPVRAELTELASVCPTPPPTPAAGQATVYFKNLQGNPSAPNSQFTVDVAVKNNTSKPVIAFGLRIVYNSNSAELPDNNPSECGGSAPFFTSVENVDLGVTSCDINLGPVISHDTSGCTSRAIGTLGNASSALKNLTIFRLRFKTTAAPSSSHQIYIVPNPPNFGLVGSDYKNIPHGFADAWIGPTLTPTPTPSLSPTPSPSPTATPECTPAPTAAAGEAVIYLKNLQGNPVQPLATFTVDVAVRENTQKAVGSSVLQVYYDKESVSLTGIRELELLSQDFPTTIGASGGDGTCAYSVISNAGNLDATLLNLSLCQLTFTVKSNPKTPFRIALSDYSRNPGNAITAADFTSISYGYDNSYLASIPLPATPSPTVSPTPSSSPSATPIPSSSVTATPTVTPIAAVSDTLSAIMGRGQSALAQDRNSDGVLDAADILRLLLQNP